MTATASPGGAATRSTPSRGPYRLCARDYAGEEPIVLLHGFPANQHLYDRLVPELA